jgi:glutamate-ammonia-ligase adenylyltransferase
MGKVLAHVFPVMAPALALAADPDAALVRLQRVTDAVGDASGPADVLADDPEAARRLAHLAAASSFATDLLVADPGRVAALSARRFDAADPNGMLAATIARTAGRELLPRETGTALSAIADRVVADALAEAMPELPFAAIGLGKLGAEELNVASDLDLVFVYEGEGPDDLRLAVDAAERTLRCIRERGWEPDADLRPEGRSGPLARSLVAYLEYWERYAELWEYQSLLRARFVAGDEPLGRRFEMKAADFAYPPGGLTVDRVDEIRHMRERIERERVKPPEATKFHFKLGRGSLADVQFAVELALLRHGGRVPQVRTRRTLEAIELLAEHRCLAQSAAHDLGEAFVFLSDVKNVLEMDRRLHAEALPLSPAQLIVLARRLGYEEYPRQALLDDYLRITHRCRRAMERVFLEEARTDR